MVTIYRSDRWSISRNVIFNNKKGKKWKEKLKDWNVYIVRW
jgi:hypothetical protein